MKMSMSKHGITYMGCPAYVSPSSLQQHLKRQRHKCMRFVNIYYRILLITRSTNYCHPIIIDISLYSCEYAAFLSHSPVYFH